MPRTTSKRRTPSTNTTTMFYHRKQMLKEEIDNLEHEIKVDRRKIVLAKIAEKENSQDDTQESWLRFRRANKEKTKCSNNIEKCEDKIESNRNSIIKLSESLKRGGRNGKKSKKSKKSGN